MKYMGSKARIAKYILPIIQKRLADYNIHTYIEPFSGGMNMIDKVRCEHKIASDNNEYLIEIFKNMDKLESMLPEMVSKEHYDECRKAYYNKDFSNFPQWYIGAIGFLASYSGRFYSGGFNGQSYLDGMSKRCYYDEAKRNLLKQLPSLEGIDFVYGDYEELYSNKTDCLFYCDIPYKSVKQYDTSINFDYDRFWNWAEKMSEKNIVLVSEYIAPDNWDCIWSKPLLKTMNHGNNVNSVEKLFELRE
jgi:DNA adenine methylase